MALTKNEKEAIIAQNQRIEQILALHNNSSNPSDYDISELLEISKYEGYGGTDYEKGGEGLLYEFYTPEKVIECMWRLCCLYGIEGAMENVLEPACGTGRFINSPYRPARCTVVGYEPNPTSALIAKILNPKAVIHNKEFESVFITNQMNSAKGNNQNFNQPVAFDLVIGNPPYGDFQGYYAGLGERSYTKATNYIEYFITRGLDLLKSGGLLCYIIGGSTSTFLGNGSSSVKEIIEQKADLIDAYQFPEGVFPNTDIMSQIVLFRKK